MAREIGLGAAPPDPVEFVPRVFSEIDTELTADERKEVLSLVKEAREKTVSQGRNPFSFAASAAYVVSNRLTQRELAEVSNSTPNTIRESRRDIEAMIEEREKGPTEGEEEKDGNHSTELEGQKFADPVIRSPVEEMEDLDSNRILVSSQTSSRGTPLADGGQVVVQKPNQSTSQEKELPMHSSQPLVESMSESDPASTDEEECVVCGEAESRLFNIHGDWYCRECGYTLLYSLPPEQWESLREVEERIEDGYSSEQAREDVDSEMYHPPYPGSHKRRRFNQLSVSRSEGYPQFNVNITRPLRVSPVDPGDKVQFLATTDPHGIPVLDLYYVDEDEDTSSTPNVRTISGQETAAHINIPESIARRLLESKFSVPLEKYDGTDSLIFWPQAMPDRIRLYAVAFESEWEAMRREFEEGSEAESGTDRSEESTESEESQEDTIAPAGMEIFQTEHIVDAVSERSVTVDDLVDALEATQEVAEQKSELLEEQSTMEPVAHQDQVVYVVPSSFWGEDPLSALPEDPGLREAVRQVHYYTADQMDDDVEADLSTQLLAMDAFVVKKTE
ncbi:transcription initiation factor IIB family protein [Halorhabdus rudnickae]|uniref:transcription initiation factor IIB family protein n=1 Tax=Halorhabdus rudnickae TaxID=1775544 RepID=UPI001FCEAF72|nr:transcription initiation factor IIB family protein [Halorhabdus rudnickae]